jgi:hypothetical protein
MPMHIEGTHQHAKSARVYAYRADYETHDDGEIVWRAEVAEEGEVRAMPKGRISTGSPAAETIAESAVVDAVLKAIDGLEDSQRLS